MYRYVENKKGARTAGGVVCVLLFLFCFRTLLRFFVGDRLKKYPLRVSQGPIFISALFSLLTVNFHGIDGVSPNLEMNLLFLVLLAVLPQHAYAHVV